MYGADCTPYDYTPARSYASLGRTPTPRRGIISDVKGIDSSREYTPDQCYKLNSLNRLNGFLCGVGGAEFRLPLRHLNLMPSSLAARAFSLSYRQNGNGSVPVATFQVFTFFIFATENLLLIIYLFRICFCRLLANWNMNVG